jgi:dnd system-associated protein 4
MTQDLYSVNHTIYWPELYEPVVNFLVGNENSDKLFRNNAELLVFAASVGLRQGVREKLVGERKEVDLDIILRLKNDFRDAGSYIFIIALLSSENIDLEMLRGTEAERECVRIFGEYVCGGLKIISELYQSAGPLSPYMFVQEIASGRSFAGESEANSKSEIEEEPIFFID